MKKIFVILTMIITISESMHCNSYFEDISTPTTVLYNKVLDDKQLFPELIFDNGTARYTTEGLNIEGKNNLVRLDKYYSLGERLIRYHVKFTDDVKAVFQSNTGDFKVSINLPEKLLSIETTPIVSKKINFLNSNNEYLVEIYHTYQQARVKIIDVFTGESEEIQMMNDGPGGYGVGVINMGFRVGMQHDYYCVGIVEGTSLLIKQITVLSQSCNLALLIYGDSITEPEDYFPTSSYPKSWTQLIMNKIKSTTMSSGRGGCTINELLLRIKNELPYIKAKYVMITIGTNGGNTIENLSELIEYILSQNAIPILNNIPCNESRTHIEVNKQIEIVRQKYGIKGCKFDLATSINNDGLEVDQSTMFHEDYTGSWGQIYHHPNEKGSVKMFTRTLIDIPEIYQ